MAIFSRLAFFHHQAQPDLPEVQCKKVRCRRRRRRCVVGRFDIEKDNRNVQPNRASNWNLFLLHGQS